MEERSEKKLETLHKKTQGLCCRVNKYLSSKLFYQPNNHHKYILIKVENRGGVINLLFYLKSSFASYADNELTM